MLWVLAVKEPFPYVKKLAYLERNPRSIFHNFGVKLQILHFMLN